MHLLPFFEIDNAKEQLPIIIKTAQQFLSFFRNKKYKDSLDLQFEIDIKIGLGQGNVRWGIVGREFKSFYFKGGAIDDAIDAALQSKGGEIIVSKGLETRFLKGRSGITSYKGGYQKVVEDLNIHMPPKSQIQKITSDIQIAKEFLLDAVASYTHLGEFRNVVSVFIGFEGSQNFEEVNAFATIVLDLFNAYSGYFKEIDCGDKGSMIVGFFGAPVTYENVETRAISFALELRQTIRDRTELEFIRFRIGMSYGLAFTGIVGGNERCQYSAVSNRVNLAVRIMTNAEWGEILIDDNLVKTPGFTFLRKNSLSMKGFKNEVDFYALEGKAYSGPIGFEGEMVGRQQEFEVLFDFSSDILTRKVCGFVFVYGEAGIGKSRIVHALKKELENHCNTHTITCQSDQILRKPLNPFIYFLLNFFQQSGEMSLKQNRALFEENFNNKIADQNIPLFDTVQEELIRTKSILASQIGLIEENSLWNRLDAKGRLENTFSALANLLILESLKKPLIVELEDGHWLDNMSGDFLKYISKTIKGFPILFLITSRYDDTGKAQPVIQEGLLDELQIEHFRMDLHALNEDNIIEYTEKKLNGRCSEDLILLLIRSTSGNPFYLEQMLEYFLESNLLQKKDGIWHLIDENIQLSTSINAVLMARIDRLSDLAKETVKAAAVIGREFDVPVLSEVMYTQDSFSPHGKNWEVILKEQIQIAEKGQIWRAMNEIRYIFKHSLLRETVYEMQLRTRLRELHKQIAMAIEKLYPKNIEEKYVDLAYHFERADEESKYVEYLIKSAKHAKSNFQNQLALKNYSKLIDYYTTNEDQQAIIKTSVKKGNIQELTGDWEGAHTTYEYALKASELLNDELLKGISNSNMGHLHLLKGQYSKAFTFLKIALDYFEKINDLLGLSRVNGYLGSWHFRQGKYTEAKQYFWKSIFQYKEFDPSAYNAQIVSNLGLTFMNLGDYDAGIKVQLEYLAKSQEKDDKQGMATLHTNVGIVYFEKGDYNQALAHYNNGLALSRELGNKFLSSIAIGCIGSVHEQKGDLLKAMELYEEDLRLAEEMGDKQGISIAHGLIGDLLYKQGKYNEAVAHHKQNLNISNDLGYQKRDCKSPSNYCQYLSSCPSL